MPYIGRELDSGNYLKLDDISSSFNGSTTTFNLTAAGKAFFPGSAFSILVNLAGVAQEPESAYQINNATITFATAPVAGDQFFCIVLGVAHGVNVPGNGTVNGAQLAKPFNYDGYFYLDDANNRVGVGTATPAKPLHVVGEGQFDSVRVLGDLTVDGTTTTLDTVVTEVDRLEVGANNNTVGLAVTQSGSGDAAIFMGGSVGIGTDTPTALLHLAATEPQFYIQDSNSTGNNVNATLQFRDSSNSQIAYFGFAGTSDSNLSLFNTMSGGALRFGTAGSEKLHITSGGLVGVNCTPLSQFQVKTATNANIALTADSSEASIEAFNDAGSANVPLRIRGSEIKFKIQGTEKVRITSAGSVGIGTNSPQSQFEVYGTSPIVRSKHSTSQKYTQINHNGTDGYVDWSSGNLILRGASNVERFCITSTGKIGINTSAPLHAMHFKNAMSSSPSFIHMEVTGSNAVGGGGGIAFDTSASNAVSNNGLYLATISGVRNSADDGSNDLVFKTSKSGVAGDDTNTHSPKEKLRIDSTGRLLLGTGGSTSITCTALFQGRSDGATNSSNLRLAKGSSTPGTTDSLGIISFADSGSKAAAQIQANRDSGTWTSGSRTPGTLLFMTAPDSSANSAIGRLRITSTGDVQINVDGSGGASSQQGILRFYRTSYSSDMLDSRIVFDTSLGTSADNSGKYAATIAGKRSDDDNGSSQLSFYTCNSSNSFAAQERLRIASDGAITINAVPGTNNNANQAVLFQTAAGVIDGGSGLLYNPAEDALKINGNIITSQSFFGAGAGPLMLAVANYSSTQYIKVSNKIEIKGNVGINEATPAVSLDLSSNTDAVSLPTGTTAQRPSGTDAYIRKNSTNNALEFYNGTNWVEIITDYFPTGSTTLG